LLLYFYDKPIAVAINVGSNGFVIGMNPRKFREIVKKAGISSEDLLAIASWPHVS